MSNTQPDKDLTKATNSARNHTIGQAFVTEFFHEGLARIVPGLVLLALYAHKLVAKAFDTFHGSSIIFGLSILVSAWFMGVILENVLFTPFILALRILQRWSSYSGWIYKKLLPELAPSRDESERIRFLKYNGEKVMYRSMIIVCLLTAKWTPSLFSMTQWVFSECQWNYWYGFGSAFFFFCCWFFAFITNPQYRPKTKGLAPD